MSDITDRQDADPDFDPIAATQADDSSAAAAVEGVIEPADEPITITDEVTDNPTPLEARSAGAEEQEEQASAPADSDVSSGEPDTAAEATTEAGLAVLVVESEAAGEPVVAEAGVDAAAEPAPAVLADESEAPVEPVTAEAVMEVAAEPGLAVLVVENETVGEPDVAEAVIEAAAEPGLAVLVVESEATEPVVTATQSEVEAVVALDVAAVLEAELATSSPTELETTSVSLADLGDEVLADTEAAIAAALHVNLTELPAGTENFDTGHAVYADSRPEIDDDSPLLDDELEDGIASIFAALHQAAQHADSGESDEPAGPLSDEEAIDGVTFRLLGELDRLWHRAA